MESKAPDRSADTHISSGASLSPKLSFSDLNLRVIEVAQSQLLRVQGVHDLLSRDIEKLSSSEKETGLARRNFTLILPNGEVFRNEIVASIDHGEIKKICEAGFRPSTKEVTRREFDVKGDLISPVNSKPADAFRSRSLVNHEPILADEAKSRQKITVVKPPSLKEDFDGFSRIDSEIDRFFKEENPRIHAMMKLQSMDKLDSISLDKLPVKHSLLLRNDLTVSLSYLQGPASSENEIEVIERLNILNKDEIVSVTESSLNQKFKPLNRENMPVEKAEAVSRTEENPEPLAKTELLTSALTLESDLVEKAAQKLNPELPSHSVRNDKAPDLPGFLDDILDD